MLANERPLWEAMLGLIKLGAVMIPATTLLVGDDLRDRFDRGDVKHVIVGHAHAGKFDEMPGQYTRIVVGADVAGWQRFEQAYEASADFTPEGRRWPATRCCCTSPRAPPPSPSWCCTATRATRWGICRPCTGSA
jgi:hypothetical protein